MTITTLDKLPINHTGFINKITASGIKKQRLLDLGFFKDSKIQAVLKSPMGNPIAYLIRGTLIAIRNEDAKEIFISY